VRSLNEAVHDPQLAHRPFLARAAPDAPLVPVAAFAFAHDGPRLERRAPGVGEHSDAVLREAGYDDAQIAALRSAGVIA
jgi:crotonobetainyl-CoA:carnitine CoA-transferase CaiB-like acyl-CoA transferase